MQSVPIVSCLYRAPSTHQCWSFKCFYCWPLPCQPAVGRHCSELHQQMSSSRLVSKYYSPSMSRKSQQNIYDEILKYFLNALSRDLKLSRIKKCRTQTVTACTVMSECCQGGDTFAHYINQSSTLLMPIFSKNNILLKWLSRFPSRAKKIDVISRWRHVDIVRVP